MSKKNLLAETILSLKKAKRQPSEVSWVGSLSGNYVISWERFCELSGETNYDSGYGSQEVADDLVVVGKDWWLERHEYGGSEWWEYKTLPKKQDNASDSIASLTGYMWLGMIEGSQ